MKEPEISQFPPLAPRAPGGPRYRYYSNPPTTVSLRLADLLPQIPEAARLPGFNAEHSLELSCEEIFNGPVPRLPLSRLAEIASEHIRIDGLPDTPVNLPIARLALAYRFISGRELIEEAPPPEEIKAREPADTFAPKGDFTKDSVSAEKPLAPPAGGTAVGEMGPAVSSGAAESKEDLSATKIDDAPSKSPADPLEPASPGQAEEQRAAAEEAAPPESEAWRPITVFPILRRKAVEPQLKPPVAPLRPVLETQPPRPPFAPAEFSDRPPHDPDAATGEVSSKDSAAPVARSEAVIAESGQDSGRLRTVEIVDHDELQAVFMTEEMLSVDRVVQLCGGLPGIKSCVLAHGAAVIASHNVPESIDLVSLSAHALEMLTTMRQSAARMGVGAVPAVTIHAEKGPITFFHQDDLCLLVLHKDRGFVPGVREKLQEVVEHLARSNPALTEDDSHLTGGSKKPSR